VIADSFADPDGSSWTVDTGNLSDTDPAVFTVYAVCAKA
jgi:hypothetical protein